MTETCKRCGGELYPRQCRNSAAWRRAHGAPGPCPYGRPLGYSPDGRLRGDYRAAAGSREPRSHTDGPPGNAPLCRWAARYTEGCCDGWKVLCRHPGHAGHRGLKACRNCPDYEAVDSRQLTADSNAPAGNEQRTTSDEVSP
jgi:hypothetical protein